MTIPALRNVAGLLLSPLAARLALSTTTKGENPHLEAFITLVRASSPERPVPARTLRLLFAELEAGGLLGLPLVEAFPPMTLGFIDYYVLASGTLREALTRLVHCLHTLADSAPVALEESEPAGVARLVMAERNRPRLSRRLGESFLGLVASRCRYAVGPSMRFTAVEWIHPERDGQAACEAYFEAPNVFGCEQDALVFDAALLDAPLVTASPTVSLLLEAHVSRHAITHPDDALLAEVRQIVGRALPEAPTLSAVARAVGVSPRTLQRRLAERGLQIHALLDEARRERALALVDDRTLSLERIAERVGFAASAPFFRAFRRWTGTTPGAFRARKHDAPR